jgi:hypothetical protein
MRIDMSQVPRQIKGQLRSVGGVFLAMSATESKRDVKKTLSIFDMDKNSVIIRSSPVTNNHMYLKLKRPPSLNGFYGDDCPGSIDLLKLVYLDYFVQCILSEKQPDFFFFNFCRHNL